MLANGVFYILNTAEEEDEVETDKEEEYNEKNIIVQEIRNNMAVEACDASIENNVMARY